MKMKIRHISDLKYIAGGIPALAAGVLLVLSAGFSSCSEQIEIDGNLDASSIENATAVHGFLNVLDNPRLKVTEVRTEPVTLQLQAALTNKYDGIAYFTIEAAVDDDLVAQYNTQHGTDFPVLPAANVTIEDNGKIAIAPGDKVSYTFNMTVSPEDLAEGTYVLPVRTVSQTGDVTVTEKDAVKYLLFSMLGELPSTAKSSGIISIAYIEVNGFNPLNAGEWTLASSGTQFFDIVNIFAANIKFDEATGRVYLSFNPNVQAILDNRDKYIKPLQDKGMKVCLTILPDHDGVGFANLTDKDIRAFASELKATVDTYGLDGIDFDDEYAEYSTHNRPGFVDPSSIPFGKLCYEVKRLMPDKLCTVYFIGSATEGFLTDVEGMEPGDFIDYAYYAQYGSWSIAYTTIKGMDKSQWGPYSWDMNDYGEEWMMTDQVRSGGYGVQVCYDLRSVDDPNVSAGKYEYTLGIISQDIYGEGIVHSGINHAKDW